VIYTRLVLLLLTFWASISNAQQKLTEEIQSGESLLFNNPSKGLDFFEALLERHPYLPDSSQGLIEGLIGTGYAMRGEMDSASQYMESALRKLPDCPKRTFYLKNLASVYRLQKRFRQADSIFTSIIDGIPDIPSNGNSIAMMMGEHASVFVDQGQNRMAITLLKKSLKICLNSPQPDTTTLTIIRNKLATLYMITDDYVLAARELEGVIRLTDPSKDLYNYCTSTASLSRCWLELGNRGKALSWLDKALQATRKLKNSELEGFVLMLYGKSSDMAGMTEKALAYFKESFRLLKTMESDYIYDCAAEYLDFLHHNRLYTQGASIIKDPFLLSRLNELNAPDLLKYKTAALPIIEHVFPAEALLTSKEIIRLQDSVSRLKLEQSLVDSRAEFRLLELEQDKVRLEQHNQLLVQENAIKHSQILIAFISALALVFIIMYLVLRHRNKLLLQQKALEETRDELSIKDNIIALETRLRSMREKVIEQQKEELLISVSEIELLKNELRTLTDVNIKSVEQVFMRHLSEAKGRLGLENFLQQFNTVFPQFFSELSRVHPSLSTSDLQFCALIRMNLSIKDISSILHIETKSAYRKKYRIEDKMGLEAGVNLESVVFDITR